MHYWWVNQKRTYRHEVPGGYLWSPKRRSDGRFNPYYEFMKEVSPGDLIFSFANALIRNFGISRSFAYTAPKPDDFGTAGRLWDNVGWRIDVTFREARKPLRPADWIEQLRPLLPPKYSPLQGNGHGNQSMYLTRLDEPLALALASLLGQDVLALALSEIVGESDESEYDAPAETWLLEDHLRKQIEDNSSLADTERQNLVLARRGQGVFRRRVQQIENACRITGVGRAEHLRASHSKPWRDSTNEERLNGENGLLLTPSIDHLYDRGFISFANDGRLLVSPVAHHESLERMGVPTSTELRVGRFSTGQRKYLEYHRDMVFLRARVHAL